MNAVTTTSTASTALGALKSLKSGIANVQQTMVRKGSNPFLRMLKDGTWVYGQEDIEVEAGSLWAANPLSIEHGWTAWDRTEGADNSKGPLGEVMVPMHQPCPPKTALHDVGAEWSYQMSIEFRCLNGTDKGEQVLYKANSVGASGAMDDLIKAISQQLEADETKPVPVVKLESSHYSHKKYGKTYVPEINVVDWVPMLGEPEVDEPEAGPAGAVAEAAQAKVTGKPRTRSVPATKAEEPDDEIAKLEAMIAKKKADKDALIKTTEASMKDANPVDARKAALLAEMAALEAEEGQAGQQTAAQPDAAKEGQPLRRRRNA